MPIPDLTPEQLAQLNSISGESRTRKREARSSETAPAPSASPDGNSENISFTLPVRSPEMPEEDYARLIKNGLTQHLGAIHSRAQQRGLKRRDEVLEMLDPGEKPSFWQEIFSTQAKAGALGNTAAIQGEDYFLANATDRALKLLNQKTNKDKKAGDTSSGLTRELFDVQTAKDVLNLGFGELAENIVAVRALEKAGKNEPLSPTEQDVLELLRTRQVIEEYIAQRGGATTGAKVGGGVAASLPYMANFAMTSGIGGSASKASKALGSALIKKQITSLMGKGLQKTADYGVRSLAMTPLQVGSYTNYFERAQGQFEQMGNGEVVKHAEPEYKLMYKAAADSFTDVFTEHIGGELGQGVKKLLGKPIEQIGRRMGVKLSFDKILPGYTRSKYLTDFRNRALWNGTAEEWLEEVAGGIMSPLLTGEHERWKENLSGENLWTTFLTTSLMGAGFSALELPSVASYAHKTHVLKTHEKQALASIENETLRKQVFKAMQRPTMAEQSQALAGIDWSHESIGQADAARAADYTRFHIERQILDGMELGDAQGDQFHKAEKTVNEWAYRGRDGQTPSEEIITGQTTEGTPYIILSGEIDNEGKDGSLFVLDMESGQPVQIDRSMLENIAKTPLADFSAEQFQMAEQQAEAESRKRQQQRDMEIGTEAGIDPNEVAQMVIPGSDQYVNGDEIITKDGTRGRITGKQGGGYIVQLDNGQFIHAPLNTITGVASPQTETLPTETLSTTEEVPSADAIPQTTNATGTVEALGNSSNPQVAERLADAMQHAVGRNEAARAIQRMIDTASSPTEIEQYTKALELLQKTPLTTSPSPTIEAPIVGQPAATRNRPNSPNTPKKAKNSPPPLAKQVAELGDYVSIEDVILRDIASGQKFAWKDNGQQRGLARELGFTNNERERRARIGILSVDGLTPEQYAERLYFDYGSGNQEQNGQRWSLDDLDIKDAVLDILSRIHSSRQAYDAAAHLHNVEPHPYDEMTDEDFAQQRQYEAQQKQMQEELLFDQVFEQLAQETTPEQWEEINNLFVEGSDKFAETANFEALAEQPATAIEVTNEIISYDQESKSESAITEDGESDNDARRGERSSTPASNGSHFREQGAEPSAVRHERGLDTIPGNLTDQERRVAEAAASDVDAQLAQLRQTLDKKRAQYASEKRHIGTAYNQDNQTTLFEQPHDAAANGNLFDVPRDFSTQVVKSILDPLLGEIESLQDAISKVEAARNKLIADTVEAYRAQTALPLEEAPARASSEGVNPAVEKEYKHYYTDAVDSFGSIHYSVIYNSLIKDAFVRDVRRLAKKDPVAALRLVNEVNAAAKKFADKVVLTPRHSIFGDLEALRLKQSNPTTKPDTSVSQETAESTMFRPVEQVKHTKTQQSLFSVKLADRIERDMFDTLKRKAKAHNGYYSSYTKSFIFNAATDAETFRAEYDKPAAVVVEKQTQTPLPSQTATALSDGNNQKYGADNKLVTTDQYEELKKRMRTKLGQLNAGFDPEILSIGAQMAAYHIEAGARKFSDYATRMIDDLGDAIRPYLKSLYTAAREMPGMEEYAGLMDDHGKVMQYDTERIGKPTAQSVPGSREYRLAGYYDMTRATEKDESETGNLRPEKNFKKDLIQFSKELAAVLGWEHETDRKNKTIYATTNIAPAGGDGTFILWAPDTNYGLYVNIPVQHSNYTNGYGYSDDLKIEDTMGFKQPILWRITTKDNPYRGLNNCYAAADITVSELAALAKKELNRYIDRTKSAETLDIVLKNEQKTHGKDGVADDTIRVDTRRPLGNGGIPAEDVTSDAQRGTARTGDVDRGNSSEGIELETDGHSEWGRSTSSRRTLPGAAETGLLPAEPRANSDQRRTDVRNHSQAGRNSRNHVIERGRQIAPAGDVSKIKANIAAIRLVKELDAEGRDANPNEKAILEKYTGWGGLASIFKASHAYYQELQELLTPEEYEAARASTTTSFYTPPQIVSSVWDMIERLGFKGGSILEPSAGIGHFFGLMPVAIGAKSDLTGVELDEISGRILRALYPDAKVKVEGFEKQRIANNSLDLVVTNVPFGTFKVHDTYDKDLSARFDIHDYFIAKSIRKLKPGALGVFITSTSTLDKSTALRNWVTNDGNADFIGAVRLNTDTFKSAAGTETSADIIVIRKRDENGLFRHAANMQTTVTAREEAYLKQVKRPNGKTDYEEARAYMVYNKYYFDHPEYMAGEMRFGFEGGNDLRPTEQRCAPVVTIDQTQVIKQFADSLPKDLSATATAPESHQTIEAPDDTKEGGLLIIEGKPYIKQFGTASPVEWNAQKVKGSSSKVKVLGEYLQLKKAIADLLDAERKDLPNIEQLRAALNFTYNKFTHRYGTLSRNISLSFLRDDVEYPAIAAIEEVEEITAAGNNQKGYTIKKSDIFSRRVIEPLRQVKVETATDAVNLSLYHRGKLDLPYIAELLNRSLEDVQSEVLAQELAYINPTTGLLEERNEYLSGNVREKLEQAQQANEFGNFDANIRALSKLIPMELPLSVIKISLGSTWIPTSIYERFFKEKFNVTAGIIRTASNKYISKIHNKGNSVDVSMGLEAAPGTRLALDCMNKTQTYISKSVWDSATNKSKQVKDPEAMAQAAIKQAELAELFEQWCKQLDETITDQLVEIYNRTFNSTVERRIDVSTFDYFPNASHIKKPRDHQKVGVMRALHGATLLAHEVGTGKTITLISTAMEMRRLGIAQKPCIVVQRSTFEQFVCEIKSLYPAARVLVPSAKDLSASQRQQLYAKIAYNDWDIVVLYHGYLDAIPDDPTRVNQYIDSLIEEKLEQLHEIEANAPDNAKRQAYGIKKAIEGLEKKKVSKEKSIKDEEKIKSNARARVSKLLDRRTDETMTFEQLGIDALLVDEAHAYKKLGFSTNLQNIKGIDPTASQRAQSIRLKTQYILNNKRDKNVVFATGTPISNTMAEMWTFLRYLLPLRELQEHHIADFDSFANNFGSIEESAEFSTNGKFKVANRFASFCNMPELLSIWKKVAHTVLTEDVPSLREGVGTPRIEGGKPTDILLDQTPALQQIMRAIRAKLAEYEAMSPKKKKENSHIPLVMFGLAKRAAIDVRLINPDLPDDPNSKVNNAVRETLEDLKATADYKGTAAIFCDSYQSRDRRFNLFEDMKRKFVEAGVPTEQIAIIHDFATDEQKALLFRRINKGDVRIVLGTTEKLGIGVNMQERLHLLVNLDVPVRPMDYLQRIGRIIRQGNTHLQMEKTVRILRLGVKNTLDVTGYQRLKIKEAFIRQVMKGDITERTLEEIDTDGSDSTNFGQMMASLSGSEAALALSLEQNKLRKLQNAKSYHEQHQIYVTNQLKYLRNVIETTPIIIKKKQAEKAQLRTIFPDDKIVSVEIGKSKAETGDTIEALFVPLNKRIEAEAETLHNNPNLNNTEVKTQIKINGQLFDITIKIERKFFLDQTGRIFREVYYQCRELPDIQGCAGAKLINLIPEISKIISGREYDEAIQKRELGLETSKADYERLKNQVSGIFPKQAELEVAESRIAELETQMAKELAEIEAQTENNEVDSTIEIDPDELIEDDNNLFRDGDTTTSYNEPTSEDIIAQSAISLAKELRTPVTVVRDINEIKDNNPLTLRRKRQSKGYYNPKTGQTVVVIPNITTIAEAEATVLHEIVGHMGLRSLLGKHFGTFLDKVYDGLDDIGKTTVARIMEQERDHRANSHRSTDEVKRIATEEYLAQLAEGATPPSRFARIIGKIRSLLREVLRVPLRIGDRDIAYTLWLSKHRRKTAKTAAEAVADATAEHKIRQKLYGVPEGTRYRMKIFDDPTPEQIERYSVEQYVRERKIVGTLLGEKETNEFALRVYGLIDDMGRTIIDNMGSDRLKSMRKYLALHDLQKLTDSDGYKRVIDELMLWLPEEKKQEIISSMRKHLDFVLSDKHRRPLRRRTMANERPLPDNYKYVAEYVEELLKKKREQPAMAPAGGIEPTVIYDKRKWSNRQLSRFVDSTLPIQQLQEEIMRRGGKIDDLTDIHKHLNHLTSIAKTAIDRYTKEYLDPVLNQIVEISKQTNMTEVQIIDYITAQSSLERQASGIAALSPDPRDPWNEQYARHMVADFHRRVGNDAAIQKLWRAINAANDRVLEILVEDGMLAPEHRKLIKGHGWEYYVPLRDYDYNFRDTDGNLLAFDATEIYDFTDSTDSPRPLRKVLHEAEGRTNKPRNPVAQMVNIGIGAIIAAKTNRARQSALRLAQNNSRGSDDLFRVDKVWLAKGVGNRWVTTTIDPSVEDIEISKAARKEIARLKKEMDEALNAHDDELADYLYNRIEETEQLNIVREAESDSRFESEGHLGQSQERQRKMECYVNGIRYMVTFADPAVANAINQYNRLAIPKWLDDTVGNATRWLAQAFTSRNPAFVAANFLRDVQHAALVHAVDKNGDLRGFTRNIPPCMATITRELRGKAVPLEIAETGILDVLNVEDRALLIEQFGAARVYDTLYGYFRDNGGETGFVHSKDLAEAEKEIMRYVAFRTGRIAELVKASQRSERVGIVLSYAAQKSGAKAITAALENASKVAENTSRFATFTASLDQGKSLVQAIDDAKNITVNFNRRGTVTRPLGMFYVFFNASVQGAAQIARVANRNRGRFAKVVAALTAAGFINSLLVDFFLAGAGGDDDRDYKITEYEKHNHLIIPYIGKQGYLKIPLPQGFRAFFGIGTTLHDLYRGKFDAEDAARMMLTMLYEDFSPVASPSPKGDATRVLIPTAMTPWYDIWYAGEDAFGYPVGKRSYGTTDNYPLSEMGLKNVNKGIYYLCRSINQLGGGDENTPAGMRANGKIDPLLRSIFEWNPSHVEHILTYYGGGMGKFVKDVVHTTQAVVTPGEEISRRDLPIVNRFFGTAIPENPTSEYYTLKDCLINIEAKYKRQGSALDRHDPEVQQNLQRIAVFKAHQTAVNKIRKILANTNPNTAEYEQLRSELQEAMTKTIKEDNHVTER